MACTECFTMLKHDIAYMMIRGWLKLADEVEAQRYASCGFRFFLASLYSDTTLEQGNTVKSP